MKASGQKIAQHLTQKRIVLESAEIAARALAGLSVNAVHRLKHVRMIKLLLSAVRVRTSDAERTTGVVISEGSLFGIPMRTRARSVADVRITASILIIMRVMTLLPIVLRANRTPHGLEAVREERLREFSIARFFFLWK